MNELIKIDNDGKITARELYDFLELAHSQFARWCKTNIEQDEFYSENIDWQGFDIMSNGNNVKNYRLTIDFAKHLCMLSRSENGKQARNYFVECEKQLKQQFVLPQTFAQALLLASQQAELIERQEKLLLESKPKVEFFDAVADSKTAVPMNEVAKVLNIKGMGRNNLFEYLRENKVLMSNNMPYQKYIDCNYFRVVEQKYLKDGEQVITFKTLVYQRGVDYIRKMIESK